MITTSTEYNESLWQIQDENVRDTALLVPSDEPIYKIDLNARTIKAPKFLSVAKDHQSETIFFECDRYFDGIDLSTMTCVIQYINALGNAALHPVRYYDITTKSGKIIMPWAISGCATAAPGKVEFSFRFYKIDENRKILYSLGTQPVKSEVLYGMDISEAVLEEYSVSDEILNEIYQSIRQFKQECELTWIDV